MEKVRDRSEQKAKYRQENRAAIAAYQKAYRAERSRKEEAARYYAANAASLREKSRVWRLENPDSYAEELAAKRVPAKTDEQTRAQQDLSKTRRREAKRRYRARNPTRHVVDEHTRRARKRASGGRLSLNVFEVKCQEQGGTCPYCGAPVSKSYGHLDHIMPLALGGSNTDSNVQVTCPPCNHHKSAKHPDVFKHELLERK